MDVRGREHSVATSSKGWVCLHAECATNQFKCASEAPVALTLGVVRRSWGHRTQSLQTRRRRGVPTLSASG